MICRSLLIAALAVTFQLAFLGAVFAVPVELSAGPGDDELVELGKSIPGFGGYFYDRQGLPNVYLVDPGAAGQVVKALGSDVRILRADYEFAELVGWRLALRPLLALRGIVYLDVDETTNRVVLGVDATSETKGLHREHVERELLARGIPREAVVVRETGPISELVDVQDRFRPSPGGVQINFLNLLCTLGFNATRGNVFGFVTNSHCSTVRGESDGTRYFQNLPNTGAIGTELYDPANITDSRCPAGRKCRFSDATFVRYDKQNLGALTKIVRTTGERSLVINPAGARFTIKNKAGGAVAGQFVNKVGRTTGWTAGEVIATCADFSSAITEFTLFCQGAARTFTAGGDSGSPVFLRTKRNDVTLVGLLWGGGTDGEGNTIFAYSPLANIEAEMGRLQVH